jgi:hypothetical protein
MFFPSRAICRSRCALRFFVLAVPLACAAGSPLALAQGTHLWTQSRLEEFEQGTPQGVALESDGTLREGPEATRLATTPSTYVWSVAVDKSGTAYLGTGSPATVLRIENRPGAKPFTVFKTRDVSVQVVRLGPDGALYAATIPSGKVYRLNPQATVTQDDSGVNGKGAEVVFDAGAGSGAKATDGVDSGRAASAGKPASQAHYIWAMTFDAAGRLYIATGSPAAIYRLDLTRKGPAKEDARPELVFKSDEAHIRSLAWDAKGNLIAGSDGSGLVYRIRFDGKEPQGKGYVLFDAPLREITSVAVGANGTIYAASVGEKGQNPLPPLSVQGTASIAITVVQPGAPEAANRSASVPEGSEIYALSEGQAPRKLWASKDEVVYALAARPDGLMALTGNRGRVFKIAADGSFADIAHLEAQQGLAEAVEPGGSGEPDTLLIGTGNTGKLFRLGSTGEQHEFASAVLDAGALARFGRVEVEPGSVNYEIFTRTGNVEQPMRGRDDWGWSEWQALEEGRVASPPGRFLQWKVVLHARGLLACVGVNYLPVNAAPVVNEVVVVPGARLNAQSSSSQTDTVSISFPASGQDDGMIQDSGSSASSLTAVKDRTAVTVRWAVHDENGDSLVYSLYLRGDGETVWRLLKGGLTDKAYSFDVDRIPDGGYRIKVVASDAPSHSPGEALTGEKLSERFVVDTTPPVVSALKSVLEEAACEKSPCAGRFHVTFDAEDAISPISHAQYSLDAEPWQYIDPVGGLSDARREHYDIFIPAPADAQASEHLIAVRVYDRYDNVVVAKTVIAAGQKSGKNAI